MNELRKDLRKWIAPPYPSVNHNAPSSVHHDGAAGWCTKGNTLAARKVAGSLGWIHGKRTYHNTVWVLIAAKFIAGSGKSILRYALLAQLHMIGLKMIDDHLRS